MPARCARRCAAVRPLCPPVDLVRVRVRVRIRVRVRVRVAAHQAGKRNTIVSMMIST